MAFEDDAANSAGNTPPSEGSLPTNAPAAPPIPVSAAPSPAPTPRPTPQPAAQSQAAPSPTQGPSEEPGHFFKHLSHAFAGALVGALAGPKQTVDHYEADDNGKLVPKMRDMRPRDRMQQLAEAALTGLAAGSRIPAQKSRGAAWGAGIGAGAEAQIRGTQQQDLLKRQQAQEDYETQQKAMVHKATVAMTNATTHATWQKFADDENAKDTERQKNAAIVSELQDYIAQNPAQNDKDKLTVQILTADQAMAMRETDSHTAAKHTFLPMGIVQAKDQNGNDVFEADGVTPKLVRQFAAIGGSADGQVPLPAALADDVKKYSKYDPRLKAFAEVPAGTMIPLTGLLTAYTFTTVNKGKEADGGREGEPVNVNGKLQKRNKFTGEVSEYAGGVPLSVQKEQAEISLKEAEKEKNLAEAAKAKKEAENEALLNPPASSGLTGDAYLQSLPPATQNVLKAIAEGRETRSPRQLQDKSGNPTPLAEALHRAYPDFDDKKAAAYGAVVKDFTSGPTSRALTAYGTAINHARALYDNTNLKSYIPGTDENKRYNQDVLYVATEVAKALNPTGVATETAIQEQQEALRSYTNRKAAIENAEHILTGKMAETKQRWANAQVRPSYQPPMPSLSKEALDNAEYVRNQGKYLVTDPNGKAHTFPDQASADKFKKLAGIE